MSAGEWNPTIEQGATWTRVITWTDENGDAVDISDYTIRMQARETKSSSTALIDVSTTEGSITLSDPTNGEFTITLTAAVTAELTNVKMVYDIECVSSGDTVTRLLEGTIYLSTEVTR